MNDPIVDEVRRIRDAHAAKFNYDPDAIFRDVKGQEKRSGRKYISFADDPGAPDDALQPTGADIPVSADAKSLAATWRLSFSGLRQSAGGKVASATEGDKMEVSAPFAEAQVASLNAYQAQGATHPFTCGASECREVLRATPNGWVCPRCEYRQEWAHSFMADGSWQRRQES